MMWPEWAAFGTVARSPSDVRRSRVPGEALGPRAPGRCGKPSTIPGCRPTPFRSRVPCVETWRGLPLHRGDGVHATAVIRTLVTWALLPVVVVAAGLPAAPPPPAEAPPAPAARAATV